MPCKLADPDVETEDLTWRPLGSNVAAGPSLQRTPVAPNPANSGAPPRPQPHTPVQAANGGGDLDLAGLKRRIDELEAQRTMELEQARRSGLEQGLKQGHQEASAEMQAALDRLGRTIHEVAQIKKKVRSEAENELVKLSLAIARRVLHREVTADPQSLRGVVYAALQRLQNREITRVRVFPAAVPAVRAAIERNGGLTTIEVVGDTLLQAGGLLIETSLGELDASVETQLQEIERGFTDRLQLR